MAHVVPITPSILVVDDEPSVRSVLERWLAAIGYAVQTAADADEALARMSSAPASVALCDIRMPGHDGLWLADRLRRHYPETAVIMATGVQDVGSAVTSLRVGVVDYLTKPFGMDRLQEAVARGVEWHRSAREARQWKADLEAEMRDRYGRLGQAIARLPIESDESLDALLAIVTLRDRDAYPHAYRVAALAVALARVRRATDEDTTVIERAALVHDLGKLALPDAILRKPAALSADERDLVRRHPQLAYELLRDLPYMRDAAPIVWAAQERPDGRGYPRALTAAEIPEGSRIVAVADAYDTMTRPRVFRDALSPGEAALEIERCAGTQFDPAVVEALRQAAIVR